MASIPPAKGCRCASWKPGRTVRPSSSTTRAAERPPSSADEPTAAMRPPRTATASASPPETVCTRPPRSSRSTALGSIAMAIFSPADARRAVERGFDDAVGFLADLVRVRSLLGAEEPRSSSSRHGFGSSASPSSRWCRIPSGWPSGRTAASRSCPTRGGAPSSGPSERTAAARSSSTDTWMSSARSRSTAGRRSPFGAEIADGRMYGRGSCDMKGGVAAMLLGVEAALAGDRFPGGLVYQSVIEEECGGNGALAAVLAGRRPTRRSSPSRRTAAWISSPSESSGRASPSEADSPPRLECRPGREPDRGRLPGHPGAARARGRAQRGPRAGGRRARAAVPPQRRRPPRRRLAVDDARGARRSTCGSASRSGWSPRRRRSGSPMPCAPPTPLPRWSSAASAPAATPSTRRARSSAPRRLPRGGARRAARARSFARDDRPSLLRGPGGLLRADRREPARGRRVGRPRVDRRRRDRHRPAHPGWVDEARPGCRRRGAWVPARRRPPELGIDGLALRDRHRAARVEAAAGRDVDRVRRLTAEDLRLCPLARVPLRHD